MKTLIQFMILFIAPIVVYRAFYAKAWWGILGIVAFIFTYFWSRHAAVKKEDKFIRQFLFSILVTGVVSLIIWYFLQ